MNEEHPSNDTQPSEHTQNLEIPLPQHKRRKHLVIIITLLLVTLIVIGVDLYIYKNRIKQPAKIQQSLAVNRPTEDTKPKGTQFFDAAKPIDQDLHFFKDPAGYFGKNCNDQDCRSKSGTITYYQIGTTQLNQRIIVAHAHDSGSLVRFVNYIAVEQQPGQFDIISHVSDYLDPIPQETANNLRAALNTGVTLNVTGNISELQFSPTATIAGMNVKLPYANSHSGYALVNGLSDIRGEFLGKYKSTAKKIALSDNKTFYQITAQDSPNYKVMELYATVGGVYATSYVPDDIITASSINPLQASWTNGDQNSSIYHSPVRGCGSIEGYAIATGLSKDQLTPVGTVGNKNLYLLPDSSALFKELYKDYSSQKASLSDKSLSNLDPTQFQNAHGAIVSPNALGELEVYERNDMFMMGGCGKPVIYLYPQSTTSVNVMVDADIKKSEPLYGSRGWQNVIANPNGHLTYQGKMYDSLFWEGFGHGSYPEITTGFVVPRQDAQSTIRTQLAQQGLNQKEINDFMDFWAPKLPDSPYIRLSWLSTEDMNNLAPLNISPRPQTVIRVFLDFEGLDHPINIGSQHPNAPKRQGFTVVEWGGLLKDPSLKK